MIQRIEKLPTEEGACALGYRKPFCNAASQFTSAGPIRTFRPRLPNLPVVGERKALYGTDAGDRTIYGGGVGGGGGVCGDGVLAMPKGFPPITVYDLQDAAFTGNVGLAKGPQNVYYSRTIASTDKQVGVGFAFRK